MLYFWIGLGSAVGGIMRYLVLMYLPWNSLWALLCVNVLGSFLFGFLVQCMQTEELRLALLVGFLGSFTTFSTFSYEVLMLFLNGRCVLGGLYVLLSLGLSLGAVWGGVLLGPKTL
ncbi:hypothetical protein BBW65_03395 [Helicobacter enhydrae]|uniref:Fluoride-specific ion channel FluC n=1 Tax=Helicobacter enhydrae TaxID=222136 RepID=A0A1B1U593_9HELI|nr:CrcB family protein [Helicobacter enhydrae]ANV97901.1 hypothetical protein BBW65_03395 [Helicobacter enhydrae]